MPRFSTFIALALNKAACDLGLGYFYHRLTHSSSYGDLFCSGMYWNEENKAWFPNATNSQRWVDSNLDKAPPGHALIPISLWPRMEVGLLFFYPYKDPLVPAKFSIHEKASFILKYDSCEDKYYFRPHLIPMSTIKKKFMLKDGICPSQPYLRAWVMPNWDKKSKRCDFPGYRQIHDAHMAWNHHHLIQMLRDVWENGNTPSSVFIKVQDIWKSQNRGHFCTIPEGEDQQLTGVDGFEADTLEELADKEDLWIPQLSKEEVEKNDLRWIKWGFMRVTIKHKLSPGYWGNLASCRINVS